MWMNSLIVFVTFFWFTCSRIYGFAKENAIDQKRSQMKIAVTSTGSDLNSPISPIFGRCPMFIFIDDESDEVEAIRNPAVDAHGGAGIQAAQFVVDRGAKAVITGRVGPNAMDVLKAADIPIYLFQGDTPRQALEAFKAGKLEEQTESHGRRGGRGSGRSRGRV
jgi:predicted Fe-Mo cluster-binding NifX family protein